MLGEGVSLHLLPGRISDHLGRHLQKLRTEARSRISARRSGSPQIEHGCPARQTESSRHPVMKPGMSLTVRMGSCDTADKSRSRCDDSDSPMNKIAQALHGVFVRQPTHGQMSAVDRFTVDNLVQSGAKRVLAKHADVQIRRISSSAGHVTNLAKL